MCQPAVEERGHASSLQGHGGSAEDMQHAPQQQRACQEAALVMNDKALLST